MGFPQAVGGSHVLIIRPQESACDYYNRKGYYSIIMQGVVGHFMDIYIGWPGKVHDARVFSNLSLYLYAEANSGNLFPDWNFR